MRKISMFCLMGMLGLGLMGCQQPYEEESDIRENAIEELKEKTACEFPVQLGGEAKWASMGMRDEPGIQLGSTFDKVDEWIIK